ncbi:MAG: mechanosensitive ion channel family protein [Pyrinomonadaceae bacterium]
MGNFLLQTWSGFAPAAVWWWWQSAWGDVEAWLRQVWSYTNRPLVFGNFRISLASVIIGAVLLGGALVLSRVLRAFLERRLAGRRRIDPGLQFTLLRLTHYLIVGIGVVLAARAAFNADLTSLAVLFTALSVGIGFGLQYIAGDIASGFILLFERPVRIGDFVTVKGPDGRVTEGRVHTINLRTTQILTNDNVSAIVPNSQLVNQTVLNWSYANRRARISVPVGVAYDADVDLVTKTLLRAAEGVTFLLEEPKPSVQFLSFGDSALDFRLLVWTDKPRRHPQIRSQINYHIHRLFKEAGIEIPFPQRDLNLRGGALRVTTSQNDSEHEETLAENVSRR